MKKSKNFIKIFLMLIIVVSLTGCTKMLKNENEEVVQNKDTGQNLTANILCKPTDETILKLYEENNKAIEEGLENGDSKADKENIVDIDSLESCSEMKVFSKTSDGLWTTIFVKPLAIVIIKLGELVKSYGLAIIIATLLIRAIAWPFTKKQAMQSENLKEAKPELDKLEKKYANKQDQESMMMKSQEMMAIYKKHNINPTSGCLFSFIQIPLFFAFYEAISRIPVIFEETFLGFQLGTSPLIAVTKGEYHYLIFIVLIAAATYFSFKLNSGASMSKEQEQQSKTMSKVMIVMMTFTSFSISSGIAIYWITSNVFTIFQNLLVKKIKKKVKEN